MAGMTVCVIRLLKDPIKSGGAKEVAPVDTDKATDMDADTQRETETVADTGRRQEESCGQRSRAPSWAEKLFREEDSFPHKNIAYCRDEFRVCLVSQLAVRDIDEYLFGREWGGLPGKELFQVLVVNTDDEDSDADEDEDDEDI
jgi:hypothetical protein